MVSDPWILEIETFNLSPLNLNIIGRRSKEEDIIDQCIKYQDCNKQVDPYYPEKDTQ